VLDASGLSRVDVVVMTFIPEKRVTVPNWRFGLGVLTLGVGFHIWDCANQYQGDNRGFANGDPLKETNFRTRVHIVITYDFNNGRYQEKQALTAEAGLSIRYDLTGTTIEEEARAKEGVNMFHTMRYGWSNPARGWLDSARVLEEYQRNKVRRFKVYSRVAEVAYNPVQPAGGPAIDYSFSMAVDATSNGYLGLTLFGIHDGFPNYEIYARNNDGPWVTMYQYDHEAAGKGPLSLFGEGDTDFKVSHEWNSKLVDGTWQRLPYVGIKRVAPP
jgi:hypothetical protein